MGSVSRVFKKVKRAVTKPISKAFKGVVKGIMKVGKATMRGVAKLNQKLGPLGSIALSIAMPYALAGLSTATTAAMNSTNTFLKSIGTVGNSIRTGYQAFNAGVSKTFSTITKSISKGFQRFAPQGVKNMFSNISTGAKNLYNSAKATVKKYMPKPFEGKQGMSEVFGTGYSTDGPMMMSNTDLASKMKLPISDPNYISAGQVNMKTLSEPTGWFTKTNTLGVESDKIVQDTLNKAYEKRIAGFDKNTLRYFNDTKAASIAKKTYLSDDQIGSMITDSSAAKNSLSETFGPGRYEIKTEIADLSQTGDYKLVPGSAGESEFYQYTGDKTFAKDPIPKKKFDSKAAASKIAKSLLKPSDGPGVETPFYMANQDMTMQTNMSNYGETDIKGTAGGDFFTKVYGQEAGQKLKTYYKNMNLLHQNYAGIN
jgi:hypothetical protein